MESLQDRAALLAWRKRQGHQNIGFVPTMGCLHEGHLTLLREARQRCEQVVVSIFVNPTQFGPNEDFDLYPRTFEADWALLEAEGCDALFHPTVAAIYPPENPNLTHVTLPALAGMLCGAVRPGHFDGVATVVTLLLNLVRPTSAFFGLKDYQQFTVLRSMVQDLAMPVEVIGIPTVREPDGLAMSSRNRYLDAPARAQAVALSQGLNRAYHAYQEGLHDATALAHLVEQTLRQAGIARIDYVAVRDALTLQPWQGKGAPVVLIAAHVGAARLIDNLVLGAQPIPSVTQE
ncbi:pantothenate synthetase [Magnetococcus marinus MC-1]|uniref:Pantothenate synthetase n=1 Tax=Magnetococcus marinus (strain ATCC BAA-1437 / JCM 17883 / MC-1) TaxID=156889 RepID=PANC_MAGMM|nr:pantoate--beta-alanine ligase [Magnetococcus marinus]A0L3M5.1 RecName: Full=Pantothenate synthetase; Short=PS; AltName: Full=Pantoate--beta-alanine ligase; AltName: Full=Pantoate-activating enzyme [Magnetococcus marinus MC-1]ABK42568.1 pantothenate synthetase [Magnetococcus marinus MC-1]